MFQRAFAILFFLTLAAGTSAWAGSGAAQEACQRGTHLEQEGDDEGALRYYHSALGQDPQYSEAWRMIGYLEGRRKHYKDAIAALDEYLQQNMADMDVRHYQDRLKEEAETAGPEPTAVPTAAPAPAPTGRPEGFHHGPEGKAASALRYGMAKERSNDYNEALSAYQAALAWEPRNADAWHRLGNCYATAHKPKEALRAYDRYLDLRPDDEAVRSYARTLRHAYHVPTASKKKGLERFAWEQAKASARLQREMEEEMRGMEEENGGEMSGERD